MIASRLRDYTAKPWRAICGNKPSAPLRRQGSVWGSRHPCSPTPPSSAPRSEKAGRSPGRRTPRSPASAAARASLAHTTRLLSRLCSPLSPSSSHHLVLSPSPPHALHPRPRGLPEGPDRRPLPPRGRRLATPTSLSCCTSVWGFPAPAPPVLLSSTSTTMTGSASASPSVQDVPRSDYENITIRHRIPVRDQPHRRFHHEQIHRHLGLTFAIFRCCVGGVVSPLISISASQRDR